MTEDAVDPGDSTTPEAFTLKPLRPQQVDAPAPCQDNCPCGTSVRDWIAPIAQRDRLGLSRSAAYTEAWQRIVDNNPFPAIMGRICPHPCESQCNRTGRDSAVSVSGLERFLGDCLSSLQGAVDEIVVVDTGSTDRTVESWRAW